MEFKDLLDTTLNILLLPYIYIYRYCKASYIYYKKKNNLRNSGYMVDPPFEYFFYPERYSVYKRHSWAPTTYTKYGTTYTYEEIISGST